MLMAKRKVFVTTAVIIAISAILLIFSIALFKAENEISISNAQITLVSDELQYTGQELTVQIQSVVLPGDVTLNAETDYEIVSGTDKGTLAKPNGYILNIQGKGQYTGTASVDWRIVGGAHDYSLVDYSWTGNESVGYTAASANFRCSHCGDEGSLRMDVETSVVAPTCEDNGYTQYIATLSAENNTYTHEALTDTKQANPTSATGHAWNAGVVTKEATISEAGAILYTCTNNPDHTRTEVIPALTPITLSVYKTTADGETQTPVITVQIAAGTSIETAGVKSTILDSCPVDEAYDAGILIVGRPLSYYALKENPKTAMEEDAQAFLTQNLNENTNVYVFAKKKISNLNINLSVPSCGQLGTTDPTISITTENIISQGPLTVVAKKWGSIETPYEDTLTGDTEYNFEYLADNVNVDFRYSMSSTTNITPNSGVTITSIENDENTIHFAGAVTAVHVPKSMENEDVIPATCEEAGSHNEVIRCYSCNGIISSNHVEDAALGHDWDFDEILVSEDAQHNITAIVKYHCAHNCLTPNNKTGTIGAAVVHDPTCTEDGYTEYPVSIEASQSPDGEAHTYEYRTNVIPATGHQNYTYLGNENIEWVKGVNGLYTATFKFECGVCHNVEGVDVPNITATEVPATCEQDGSVTVSAVLSQATSLDNTQHSVTTVLSTTPKLNHNWQFNSFNCVLDGAGTVIEHAYANYKCANDESHTQSVEVTPVRNDAECVAATCEANGADVWQATVAADDAPDGTERTGNIYTFVLPALGHNYIYDTGTDVTWDTSDATNYIAHFPFICDRDACGATTTLDVNATPEGNPPSCSEGGSVRAVATLTAEANIYTHVELTDTYESSSAEALGHQWAFSGFTFGSEDADFAPSYANFTCQRSGCGATDRVEANISLPVVTPVSCTEDGKETYTISVDTDPDGNAVTVDSVEVSKVTETALGHNYSYDGDDAVVWTPTAGGKYTATFNFTCTRCSDPKATNVQNITPTVIPATCESGGETSATATLTQAASPDRVQHVVTKLISSTDPLGHKWKFVGFDFDGTDVNATYICEHDSSHTNTAAASIDDVEIIDPSCTEEGKTVYSFSIDAVTSLDGAEHNDTLETDAVPAIGHDWGDWEVILEPTQTERGLQRRVCNNDASHVEEEEILAYGEPVYVNIEGEDATIDPSSEEIPKFVFKRALHDELTFTNFEGIMIDGVLIDSSLYTAKPGSVIIEFKPEFIASMGEGDHVLTALFSDGDNVGVAFKVAKAAADSGRADSGTDTKGSGSTNTGDRAHPILWIVICAAAAAAVVVIVFVKRANGKKDDDNKNE